MSGDQQALREGLPSGTELGEYEIEAAIGQGGFGVVYRAKHRYLGTVVALKEYLPATVAVRTGGRVRPRNQAVAADYEEGLRRFIEEARHLVQFRSHPGVVTCVGFFEERGTAYMAMEYEEGLPLSELLTKREVAGRPLDEGELLRLAGQVLESLAVVHQSAVLHRDIKPSNILIRKSDDRPVLIDFGAAKEDFVRYTKSSAPHTQGYAAIEQMEADGKLGPWTDLYGLGAVLWRIVAGGHPPYDPLVPVDALSRMAARFRGLVDPLPSARKLGAGRFSLAVLEAIDKCLELEPRDRPADCGELLPLLSVPVRKDLAESRNGNVRKDEGGGEEIRSREAKDPLPKFTVERGDLMRWSFSEKVGVAVLITALALLLGVFLGDRGDSPEQDEHEGGLQESVVSGPGEELAVGRLTVETNPAGARVRLLGDLNEYREGMELRAGEYLLEVSAEGYETHVARVRNGLGPTELRVDLKRSESVNAEPSRDSGQIHTFTNALGLEFVRIPPGQFQMHWYPPAGSGGPAMMTVRVRREFYLGRHIVTERQWEAVTGSRHFISNSDSYDCGGNCPVTGVPWPNVQNFLRTLNAQLAEGHYRLPTEADWEYAARAGATVKWYGRSPNEDAVCRDARTVVGGILFWPSIATQNAWGLLGMLQNREWVQKWDGGPSADSVSADDASWSKYGMRPTRGGCLSNSSVGPPWSYARRTGYISDNGAGIVGFRVLWTM